MSTGVERAAPALKDHWIGLDPEEEEKQKSPWPRRGAWSPQIDQLRATGDRYTIPREEPWRSPLVCGGGRVEFWFCEPRERNPRHSHLALLSRLHPHPDRLQAIKKVVYNAITIFSVSQEEHLKSVLGFGWERKISVFFLNIFGKRQQSSSFSRSPSRNNWAINF
jgi:hypothetical protein